MDRIITFDINDHFIEKCAEYICRRWPDTVDLSRVVCVFGGKRPALFLRRALARRINRPFYPPRVFSMDEFMAELAASATPLRRISDLDAAYLIFTLAAETAPDILEGHGEFNEFLPWAREMVSFIEQLDLENIPADALSRIQQSADIGYEIPESINALLRRIITIRDAFHAELNRRRLCSRGLMYLQAAEQAAAAKLENSETILFCNFFYLHATEQRVIKSFLDRGRACCLFQGSEKKWSVLKKDAGILGGTIDASCGKDPAFDLSLYQGFDIHSQVGIVRTILENIPAEESTVVFLPRTETLIPLLTEATDVMKEFNVSLGYPLNRTSLFTLFELLLKTQESRREKEYYARDYLGLLRHPLVKNLKLAGDPALTRVLVHNLEELLEGKEASSIGGNLFVSLEKIENEEKVCRNAATTLQGMGFSADYEQCGRILKDLHDLFFRKWEEVPDFCCFAGCLSLLLDSLVEKSVLTSFPFNLKVVEKMHEIAEEMRTSLFAGEPMERGRLWDIFRQKLEREVVAFIGSPLRGIQILGLMETRSLSFDNVIVMDMNESILPRLKIYEPLIPREVMLSLGINRLEKEEEIQRYQFMHLISSAKKVHLVYEATKEKEKSRFIEELLWKRQKKQQQLEVLRVPRAVFPLKLSVRETAVGKDPAMIEYLRKSTYSASRINTYLNCPLQFYFKYVLGLKEQEDLLEDPQATHIGTFIHRLLEETFAPFVGKAPLLDKKFPQDFFTCLAQRFDTELAMRMKADAVLLKQIIIKRLNSFLDQEAVRPVEKIVCLEKEQQGRLTLGSREVRFRYTVDRIDRLPGNQVVILDYKTGGTDVAPKNFKALEKMEMTRTSIRDIVKSFQMPLYYHFISGSFPGALVNAELYNIKTLVRTPFVSPADYSRRNEVVDICLKALDFVFGELCDPKVPFTPDRDDRRCRYCSYSLLCR